MTIELRLSNVSPPRPEPKRTIYRDIVNLPDPVKLGLTIRYFNYDSVTLYFKITGAGTGYTFGNVALGSLAAGTDAYINLDEFASRAKPTAETEENITLTLKAYTDAAYTDLKWTFDRVVHVIFINSADSSYTTDYSDNFDDGTVQGWAHTGGYLPILEVATDYVLSPPYSARARQARENYTYVSIYPNYLDVIFADVTLVKLGRYNAPSPEELIPADKWLRIVVPLIKSTTGELRITLGCCYRTVSTSYWAESYIYKTIVTPNKNTIYAIIDVRTTKKTSSIYTYYCIDDFKIISK